MKTLISAIIVTSLVTTPAMASVRDAAFATSADKQPERTSVFAGATYRVGLDRRTAHHQGRASLQFAGMKRTASADLQFGQGIEMTTSHGKSTLFVGGQDIGDLRSSAKLNGTTTAVIVGGVLLLGVLAAVAVSEYERGMRCIGEEGDCD